MTPNWFLIESERFLSIFARMRSILEELLELYWSSMGVEFVRWAVPLTVVTYLDWRWLLTRWSSWPRGCCCLVDFLGLKFTCESLETLDVMKAIFFFEIFPVSWEPWTPERASSEVWSSMGEVRVPLLVTSIVPVFKDGGSRFLWLWFVRESLMFTSATVLGPSSLARGEFLDITGISPSFVLIVSCPPVFNCNTR